MQSIPSGKSPALHFFFIRYPVSLTLSHYISKWNSQGHHDWKVDLYSDLYRFGWMFMSVQWSDAGSGCSWWLLSEIWRDWWSPGRSIVYRAGDHHKSGRSGLRQVSFSPPATEFHTSLLYNSHLVLPLKTNERINFFIIFNEALNIYVE